MKNWAEKQHAQQEHHKSPTLLLAAIKGILSVAGAMLLIAFIIWATTSSL